MRYEEKIIRPIYNPRDWPGITGVFGATADLVVGMSVVARSHTVRTVAEVEAWARQHARIYKVATRWRYFSSFRIIACGQEQPSKEEGENEQPA